MSAVKLGDRVEWTWQCSGRGHDEGCECAGHGTGVIVEMDHDDETESLATVKVDGTEAVYLSVYDLGVLQVIPQPTSPPAYWSPTTDEGWIVDSDGVLFEATIVGDPIVLPADAVRLIPEAKQCSCEDAELTYRELEQHADRLGAEREQVRAQRDQAVQDWAGCREILEAMQAERDAAVALVDELLAPWNSGRRVHPGREAVAARYVDLSQVQAWTVRRRALGVDR